MSMDPVSVFKLFRETESLLAFFEKRVKKGKGLTEGLEVARFLYWSGLLEVLRESAGESVCKFSAPKLAKRVASLQEGIQTRFKSGKHNDE